MKAEMPDFELTKKLAEIVHSKGMRIDTYTQWNSLMYETFFLENPKAKDWVQVDEDGRPIAITYGYQQNFRWRPCFNNPHYREYYKRILDYAVKEVKTDFVHFDNFSLNSEPDACHCSYCRKRFLKYLRDKYPTPEARKERFGFSDVSYIRPPTWNKENPPGRITGIKDPVLQEWVDFRTWYMAQNLLEMADYVRRMNPQVAIEVNCHGLIGTNRCFEAGIDHAKILKITDVFWSEETNKLDYRPGKPMPTKIRSYKLARRFNNILFTGISASEKTLAEALAFNGTFGYLLPSKDPNHFTARYRDWYLANKEHFTFHRDYSPVAVARLYPSMAYNIKRSYPQVHLVEQLLIQRQIPYDYVYDEHLKDLSRYRVLILADQTNMSDEQIKTVIDFVRKGGGLVATDMTGAGTAWGRMRVKPGFSDLFGGRFEVQVSDGVLLAGRGVGLKGHVKFGAGRAVYLPEVGIPADMPTSLYSNPCPMPTNPDEILAAINWAASGRLPVRIKAPEGVVANLTQGTKLNELCLHLINARNDGAVRRIPVEIDGIKGKVTGITLLSPDRKGPKKSAFKVEDGTLSFTVIGLKVYDLAVIGLQ